MKICHLTSVHSRYDIRIFMKECRSLAALEGASVSLIVADGKGDEVKDDVTIYDVGKLSGRLNRMLKTTQQLYQKAIELNCDVYHFHDPELIPTGLRLKRKGKVVVFDAHEDFAKQVLSKPYLNVVAKKAISLAFGIFEQFFSSKFDYILTATPAIREKYRQFNVRTEDINNYPITKELYSVDSWGQKKKHVAYVGGITEIRGIKELIRALELIPVGQLSLAGNFSEKNLKEEVEQYPGWEKVIEHGFVGRSEVADILSEAMVGVVTFLPVPNHIDAQPNKMFEYMSAGIPVVASHYPLWREIIEGNRCGICVNPENPDEIADAINYLMDHPEEAETMGQNGRKAVEDIFNWEAQEEKLLRIYGELLK